MLSSISEIAQMWGKVLKISEERLNEKQIYESFFADSYVDEIVGSTFKIVINSAVGVTLMNTKYKDFLTEIVAEVTESNFSLEFIQSSEVSKTKRADPVISRTQAYFKDAVINPNLTFDNFVVGEFNKEANRAAVMIASNPGKMFNPLFIYSKSGLGKTHLLHAIGNYILKVSKPGAKILYITADEFVDEYVKFVKGDRESEDLKDFFTKSVDVLLFDDVQMLANKVNTENFFFYIYNKMISDGKQIVITSDRQPKELKNLEERLVTRFSQGLTERIGDPDQNTCVEILKKKIAANGLDVNYFDEGVLELLASRFSSTVRDLEGALNRLMFHIVNNDKAEKITVEMADEAVNDLISGASMSSQLNEQKVINVVADYYNLPPSQLTGKIRTGQIALARHIAMYLIRYTLDIPLKRIGDAFGGKDHTTVMNAISKVDKMLKTDEELRVAVAELQDRLKK